MDWKTIKTHHDLNALQERSHETPCLIFKHSTSCSISRMVLYRLEEHWQDQQATIEPYFLDLIRYRELSNAIAHEYAVQHESPQALIIKDGECIYHASHLDVRVPQLAAAVS